MKAHGNIQNQAKIDRIHTAAAELHKAGAIDTDTFNDLTNPIVSKTDLNTARSILLAAGHGDNAALASEMFNSISDALKDLSKFEKRSSGFQEKRWKANHQAQIHEDIKGSAPLSSFEDKQAKIHEDIKGSAPLSSFEDKQAWIHEQIKGSAPIHK